MLEDPSPRERRWLKMLSQLEAYLVARGDCRVPFDWPDNPPLAHWVRNQRRLRSLDRLPATRVAALESIGFEWDGRDAKEAREGERWERNFRALARWFRARGHCDVPHHCPTNPELGTWVRRQRLLRARGELDPARVKRLDGLRFRWIGTAAKVTSEDRRWEKWMEAIEMLPPGMPPAGPLARWLARQRRALAEGRLPDAKARRIVAVRRLAPVHK